MTDTIWSKKLWFSVGAIASLFGFSVLASCHPTLVPLFDTFTGGVVGIAGLYLTGNVVNKLVVGKIPAAAPAPAKAPVVVAKKPAAAPPEELPPES